MIRFIALFATILATSATLPAALIVGNVGDDAAFNDYMKALGAPGFGLCPCPPGAVDYTYEVFSPQGRIGNNAGTGDNEIGLHRNNPPDSTPPTSSGALSPSSGSIQYVWGGAGMMNVLVDFELRRAGNTITFTLSSPLAIFYQASFTDVLAGDVNLLAFRTRAEATASTTQSKATLTDLKIDGVGIPAATAFDNVIGGGSVVNNVVVANITGDFSVTGKTTLDWLGTAPGGSALAWQIKAFRDVPPVNVVPEPSTYALMGTALAGLVFVRRRA
jgi:hypothetical protein